MKYQIKSTGDQAQDDELIVTDVRQHFGFLLEKYDPCPLKVLSKKLLTNQGLKDLKHNIYSWNVEFADQLQKVSFPSFKQSKRFLIVNIIDSVLPRFVNTAQPRSFHWRGVQFSLGSKERRPQLPSNSSRFTFRGAFDIGG